MPKIDITLDQNNPLFTLNERVLRFVEQSSRQEIERNLIAWKNSLESSKKVENKDILQAIKAISYFSKELKQEAMSEAGIAKLSDALFRCADFEDDKTKSAFDSKLTRLSKQGSNITKVKVAKSQWERLSKDQAQYKEDPTSLVSLDEIGAQYALYPVCATGIQISGTKGTMLDDKPSSVIKEKSTAALYCQTSLVLQ